jgi:hypothetical protein
MMKKTRHPAMNSLEILARMITISTGNTAGEESIQYLRRYRNSFDVYTGRRNGKSSFA